MKISDKILSLPPYISTAWKNIFSIHVETRPYGHVLLIELITGSKVEVPNLDSKIMEKIFSMHAVVLEKEGQLPQNPVATQTFAIPLPFPIEGLTSVLQHNPEQADTPPLPPEILEKIQSLKGVLPEDLSSMQKAEPHCNCPYCQITRAMTGLTIGAEAPAQIEEEVSAEDLTFRSWDIKQESDRLYSVTNPLDGKEHYNVFLGEPVGCTCGTKNCEHIQAVLRS